MNSFILGLVFGLIFFIALICSFYVGYRLGTKHKAIPKEQIDENTQLQIKKMNEGFRNVMNYDINVAMGVKHE